jgi:hypothetical protein
MLFSGSSCTATYHTVTNNPVGEASGQNGGTVLFGGVDLSYRNAAEKGSIGKISSARFKEGLFFIPFYQTTVHGQRE